MDKDIKNLILECKKYIHENINHVVVLVYKYNHNYDDKEEEDNKYNNKIKIKKFIVNNEILVRDFILKHTNIKINDNMFNYNFKKLDLKEPFVLHDYN